MAQVYGDYVVSGSTLTLDYANELYASAATTPALMIGSGESAVVNATYDAYAVSQLITITYNGTNWNVVGSTSGALCTIPGSVLTGECPNNASHQFHLTITPGASPQVGDTLNFALIAASNDAGVQKQLQFGAIPGSGVNNNRSKIEIASGAGFHAVGVSTAPTLIDMMASGGTYYTFVDTGAFTAEYASFNNMDESGIQLSSAGVSGPWFIRYSTFDYSGNGVVSTSTLLTLNGISQSTLTLAYVTYGESRANTHNNNYNIVGSSVGLSWANGGYTGALTGAANTEDDKTQQHILWGYGCEMETSIANSSWSLAGTWDKGYVPTSCNPVTIAAGTTVTLDISSATASSTTINGDLQFSRTASSTFTIVGGSVSVNAGGTLDMGTAASPINASSATLILAYGATAGQYGLVVNAGGNFLVYGNTKTPVTTATTTLSAGANSLTLNDLGGMNWRVGGRYHRGQSQQQQRR